VFFLNKHLLIIPFLFLGIFLLVNNVSCDTFGQTITPLENQTVFNSHNVTFYNQYFNQSMTFQIPFQNTTLLHTPSSSIYSYINGSTKINFSFVESGDIWKLSINGIAPNAVNHYNLTFNGIAPRFNSTSHLITIGNLFFNYSDAIPFFTFVSSNALSVTMSFNVGINFNIDPSFGNSTSTSNFVTVVNQEVGCSATFIGGLGYKADNMSVYLGSTVSAQHYVNISLGLYTITNSSYLVSVANTSWRVITFQVINQSWQTFTFTTPYTLTNNTIYVMSIVDNATTSNHVLIGDFGGVGTRYTNTSVNTQLSPWLHPSTGSTTYCIFVNYSSIVSSGTKYIVNLSLSSITTISDLHYFNGIRYNNANEITIINNTRSLSELRQNSISTITSLSIIHSSMFDRFVHTSTITTISLSSVYTVIVIIHNYIINLFDNTLTYLGLQANLNNYLVLPSPSLPFNTIVEGYYWIMQCIFLLMSFIGIWKTKILTLTGTLLGILFTTTFTNFISFGTNQGYIIDDVAHTIYYSNGVFSNPIDPSTWVTLCVIYVFMFVVIIAKLNKDRSR